MLLSPEYKMTLEVAHTNNPHWGAGKPTWLAAILHMAASEGVRSLIDYGCGKGGMVDRLRAHGYAVEGYDPGIKEFSKMPARADMVYCLDVLEHIEPRCLSTVLAHIQWLAPKAFFVISMKSAKEILPDGRNAHLIVEGPDYWTQQLGRLYTHVSARRGRKWHELVVECAMKRPGE